MRLNASAPYALLIGVLAGCSTSPQPHLNDDIPTAAHLEYGSACVFKGVSRVCTHVVDDTGRVPDLPSQVVASIARAIPTVTPCVNTAEPVLDVTYRLSLSTCVDCSAPHDGPPVAFVSLRVLIGEQSVAYATWGGLDPSPTRLLSYFTDEVAQFYSGNHWPDRCQQ